MIRKVTRVRTVARSSRTFAADAKQEEIGILFCRSDCGVRDSGAWFWLMALSDFAHVKDGILLSKIWMGLIFNFWYRSVAKVVAESSVSTENALPAQPPPTPHPPPGSMFNNSLVIIALLIIILNTFRANRHCDDYRTCIMHCITMVKHVCLMHLISPHCCPKKWSDWATSPGYHFTQGLLLSLHKCAPCHYLLLN